jgi:hypothetical protein
LVLSGVSLWQDFKGYENSEELVREATKAVARVLLPTITVLSAIEPAVSND